MIDEESAATAAPRGRCRLDARLVETGHAGTRARARGLILRGAVTVNGTVASKPGQLVGEADRIALASSETPYVSFGADKLLAGLAAFGDAVPVAGRVALDVGASTGGFTDVLLRRGARRVYAVDVGHGQLHPRLAADPRVVSLERTDARALSRVLVAEPVEAIVADASFISLLKVLPAALELAADRAWLIALVKPQFEVGPASIGKGGIVRSAAARAGAVAAVRAWLEAAPGWRVIGVVEAPGLQGRANEEYLIGAVRNG